VQVVSREVGMCELETCKLIAVVFVIVRSEVRGKSSKVRLRGPHFL
jgi:hypothetical protein